MEVKKCIILQNYIKMKNKIVISLVCLLLTLSLGGCSDSSKQDAQPSDQRTASNTHMSDKKMAAGNTYERPYSPSFGAETAKVTIVEFFDPACEACRSFYPFVKEILSRHPNDVRVVLRYATFHQGSETVVRMLEAARLQGIFKSVLEALLEDQQQWASHHEPNLNRAWEIAKAAGLNVDSAKAVINSTNINQILAQEKEDIRSLQISQTPTFFVNEKPLPSFGAQQLYDLVISELNK